MIAIDHTGLLARHAPGAARFLAEVLGLGAPVADGAEGDIFSLHLDSTSFLSCSTATSVPAQHIAYARTPRPSKSGASAPIPSGEFRAEVTPSAAWCHLLTGDGQLQQ
jgi:hypothetical protein